MVLRFKKALFFVFLAHATGLFSADASDTSLQHSAQENCISELSQQIESDFYDEADESKKTSSQKIVMLSLTTLAQDKDRIAELFPKKYVVKSFNTDIGTSLSKQEIGYLLGISVGDCITAKSFFLGLQRLKRKNIFNELQCTIDYGDDGIGLSIKADTFWTIRSIKITGVAFGKQSIIQSYRLHVGESFSQEQHDASVEEIKKNLHAHGYYDADVQPFFEYEPSTKSIDVHLAVRKGVAYTIGSAVINIFSDLGATEKEQIRLLVYKKIVANCISKGYNEKFITGKIKALQALLMAQGFVYVDISTENLINNHKKTVSVNFIITFKRSQKFVFLGNRFFSALDLLATIGQCNKAIGVIPSAILAEEMVELYRTYGFLNTYIQAEEDIQNCYFLVQENERSKIKNVVIKGVQFAQEKYLIKNFFKILINKHVDKKKLRSALKGCFDWYKKEGFWDAALLKKEYVCLPDNKTAYTLVCIIDEGKRRILRDIKVIGFSKSQKAEVIKKFEIFPSGCALTQDILAQQKVVLEQECKKHGYVQHLKISYELIENEIDEVSSEFDVVWRVIVDKQLHFGKTIFTGPSSAGYDQLSCLVPYKEDDIYQKDRITMFYNKLRNAGVYKSIGLQQNFMSDLHDTCDVIVTLEEDDPFEVKVRVGFAQVSKNFAFKKGSSYKLGGSFIWKNPRNKADSVVVDADVTRFERRFSAAYKQPMLFSLPLETVIKGYSNSYRQPVSAGSYKVLYEALQHGFLYGAVSKNEHYDIGMASGFEWMKIKNVAQGIVSALVFKPELVDEKILYLFSEPTIYINYLDNNINPTAGHFTLASCRVMMPSDQRSTSFIKFLFEHGFYGSLRSVIGVARIKMGHIFMQDFPSIMPSNRFYLGGANSLRGYQPDKCPPLGSFVDEAGDRQWVAQGGKSMINGNLEMRFPLPLKNLNAALFQDFGVLATDAYSLFKSSVPVAATGFGLRYVTPLGPLRFDIGWKWHKQYEEDTSYAWFLTFGYAF